MNIIKHLHSRDAARLKRNYAISTSLESLMLNNTYTLTFPVQITPRDQRDAAWVAAGLAHSSRPR